MTHYHLDNIRTLLTESFSEADLRAFCHDTPEFQPMHHTLAEQASKATIVSQMIAYAEQKLKMGRLLGWAWEKNSARYRAHAPYDSYGNKWTQQGPTVDTGVDWTAAAERYRARLHMLYGWLTVLGKPDPVPIGQVFTDVYILDKPQAFRRHSLEEMPPVVRLKNRTIMNKI